jgi:hypothetical protein
VSKRAYHLDSENNSRNKSSHKDQVSCANCGSPVRDKTGDSCSIACAKELRCEDREHDEDRDDDSELSDLERNR